jgi:hypothetical protein
MGGQRHAPAALLLGKRPGPHCTGGWVYPWAGPDGCRKFFPTGVRTRDRPARSESLYQLSYRGRHPESVLSPRVTVCRRGQGRQNCYTKHNSKGTHSWDSHTASGAGLSCHFRWLLRAQCPAAALPRSASRLCELCAAGGFDSSGLTF